MNELETKKIFGNNFGQFVKMKRLKKEWTQLDLATKLNNNFQNISRLERGETIPTIFWCLTLAEAFDISLSQLFLEFEIFIKEMK